MNRLRERTTQPVVEDRAGASVAIGEWMDVLVGPKPLSRFFLGVRGERRCVLRQRLHGTPIHPSAPRTGSSEILVRVSAACRRSSDACSSSRALMILARRSRSALASLANRAPHGLGDLDVLDFRQPHLDAPDRGLPGRGLEPCRLWRRYVLSQPGLGARLAAQKAGMRRFPLPPAASARLQASLSSSSRRSG
jgi:hypothetical protein